MRNLTLLSAALMALFFTTAQSRANESSNAGGVEIKTGGKDEAYYHKAFPEIEQKTLVKHVGEKSVFLVDANGSESYASGHIPGAIHLDAAGENFAALLPKKKDALIVAYCGGPGCKAWRKAADKLHELGYTRVQHFKGGISGWKSAGLAVDTVQVPKG